MILQHQTYFATGHCKKIFSAKALIAAPNAFALYHQINSLPRINADQCHRVKFSKKTHCV